MAPAREEQMFNNLIESNSHTREFKRRGSFFLFTIGAYSILFAVAGVASIYAYDAHLDEQSDEIVTMLRPVDFPSAPKDAAPQPAHVARSNDNQRNYDERRAPMLSVERSQVPPPNISTSPNPFLPTRVGHPTLYKGRDLDGGVGGPAVSGTPGGTPIGPTVVHITDTPPPPPIAKKIAPPIIVSKGPLTGKAIELPKPVYTAIARNTGTHGAVNVQVLIDETGKVVSAHAISGSPLLIGEAVKAAYRARFSPTRLGDQPVKVSGIITYNFLLNN
jgi:hypothetical protein